MKIADGYNNKVNVMKFLITNAFLLFLPFVLTASEADSLMNLRGYYIIRFEKDEVLNYYMQKVEKQSGGSFSTIVDLRTRIFFIPTKIGNKKASETDLIKQIVNPKLWDNDTLVYMPTGKNIEEYLQNVSKREVDLSREICLFRDLNITSPYFTIASSSNYLYKCVYIDGSAMMFTIPNTPKERMQIGLDIDQVNKSMSVLKVLFLSQVKNYEPYVKHGGLVPWYPYIDLKE